MYSTDSETFSSTYSESSDSTHSETSSSTESHGPPERFRSFGRRFTRTSHRQRRGRGSFDRCQPKAAPRIARRTRRNSGPLTMAKEVLALTNNLRRKYNLPKLRLSSTLCHVARKHCEDMARMRRMSHEGSDGRHHSSRLLAAGYHRMYSGENVAEGNYSARDVFEAWLESESHRSNLLHRKFREMGCWSVDAGRRRPWEYWTQIFGVRK